MCTKKKEISAKESSTSTAIAAEETQRKSVMEKTQPEKTQPEKTQPEKTAIEPKKKKEYPAKYKDPKADTIWKLRLDSASLSEERIIKEFKKARGIYDGHKCTNPEKSRLADETCEICAAYIEWAADQYDKSADNSCPAPIKQKLEEDFFDYRGKLPESMEHADWARAKARMEKEGKKVEKPMPAAVQMTPEELAKYVEDAEAIRNCGQLSQRIKEPQRNCRSLKYQTEAGNVKDEYEKVHKIYRQHKCHYQQSKEEGCQVCQAFVGWVESHYKSSLGEKSYPAEIKKKLEEHLYQHEGDLPSWMEKRDWARARRKIREKREWPEEEKRLAMTQESQKEATSKMDRTQTRSVRGSKEGQKPSTEEKSR